MGPQPPSFASLEYWETRFQHNKSPFDWLLPAGASAFDKHITEALSIRSDSNSDVLHIGSGTSLLSFHLRNLVVDPRQIHNIDFSQNAVVWGIQTEEEYLGQSHNEERPRKEGQNGGEKARHNDSRGTLGLADSQRMRWTQVDLLSLKSVMSAFQSSQYALIVDKSCCDAIACGEDVEVPLPFEVYSSASQCLGTSGRDANSLSRFVHPVILLALHLALVTLPGARWVAMSYSSNRFPFLTNPDTDEDAIEMTAEGFPVPSDLWRLVCKEAAETTTERSNDTSSSVVHRPSTFHWIYVFERTNTVLKFRAPWVADKLDG
jgi:hypothetical protein